MTVMHRSNEQSGALANQIARRPFTGIILAVTGVLLLPTVIAHSKTVHTVALTGQQAPGTAAGVTYGGFRRPGTTEFFSPVLNDAGQTAFAATLSGGVSSSNNLGIWSEGSGTLALVARTGDQASGTPSGVSFFGFYDGLVLNDAGKMAFKASLTGSGVTGANNEGIWSDASGGLALIVRSGDPAPGAPGGVSFSFGSPNLNDAGRTAFWAALSNGSWGIWSDRSGSLAPVARSGDSAPGAPKFGYLYGSGLNNAGQTAFNAVLTDDGITTLGTGIWSEHSGSLALVARSGDPAPGFPAGVTYSAFNLHPALNSAGKTAFLAGTSDGSTGIWSEGSGSLALVVRNGDQAPGLPEGIRFADFTHVYTEVYLNSAGRTAFWTPLGDPGFPTRRSIWSDVSGSLTLVALEGDHAPGTPAGVTFVNPSGIVLNDAGQIAFFSGLTGGGISDHEGIWATDRNGALQLIVRSGDLLEVAPGDFRTISDLGFLGGTGNSDGRPSAFNNLGQLAFSASFTDGSEGVFVSNLVAIPEPASLVLGVMSALTLSLLRRPTWLKKSDSPPTM